MRMKGLEPSLLAKLEPKSSTPTNSAADKSFVDKGSQEIDYLLLFKLIVNS